MRHLLSRTCLTLLTLAGLSRADWSFPIPTGTYPDSAAVNAVLPSRTYSDSLTTTSLSLSDQTLRLGVKWGNVPKQGARAGLQLPFNSWWSGVDMSMATAVSFFYKTSDTKTNVQFAPISDDDLGAATNDGVMMVAMMAGNTAGKTVTIALPDGIDYLPWMLKLHPEETAQTWNDVKSNVKAFQFQPMPVYDSTGEALTEPDAWLEISKVTVLSEGGGCSDIIGFNPGCAPLPLPKGAMCKGRSMGLSDFGSKDPLTNPLGGSWYAFVDTSVSRMSTARGMSSLVDRDGDGSGLEFLPPFDTLPARLSVTTVLDKGDAALHPSAGWAGIGASIGAGRSSELEGIQAISFRFAVDSFDVGNLTGIQLQVRNRSVGDSVRFEKLVPLEAFTSGEVCLDMGQLRQPAWLNDPLPSVPLSDILGFEWQVKINKDATRKAAPSTFAIGDVKLWGTDVASGISRSRGASGPSLVAAYAGALRLSYSLHEHSAAKVEVLRMDGTRVASFEAPASAAGRAFPVTLGRGTYLAVVRGGSTKLVAPFVVAR